MLARGVILTSQYTYNILKQIIDMIMLLQCASAKHKTFPYRHSQEMSWKVIILCQAIVLVTELPDCSCVQNTFSIQSVVVLT